MNLAQAGRGFMTLTDAWPLVINHNQIHLCTGKLGVRRTVTASPGRLFPVGHCNIR